MTCRSVLSSLLIGALAAGTNGFMVPSSQAASSQVGTNLYMSSMPPTKDIPYGEVSRQFRRTVYSHDDWKKHRSQDRFGYYLSALLKSGVYKNIGREVAVTTSVATFIWFWNLFFKEYQDFSGTWHTGVFANSIIPALGMPLTPFTLASPSLGLLLGTVSD